MTTTTAPAVIQRPGFGHTMIAEWTKIRSVRSTVWSLILLVVLDLGFTALFTALTVAQWDRTGATERAALIADPTSVILGGGLQLSQLTVCVLGVIVVASSLLAVPRRIPVLAAKSVVFGLLIFVLGTAVSFASFFLGAPILHSRAPVSLGDPGVLRAVIGGGLYLTMLGLFALAVGAIVRHVAAGITVVIGLVLVLAPLAQLLPGTLGKHVHAYLPSEAGRLIGQTVQRPDDLLSPWQGYAVFGAWTAVLLIVAGMLLTRRDA